MEQNKNIRNDIIDERLRRRGKTPPGRAAKGQVMLHMLASIAFSLIALGATLLSAWMLMESKGKILSALQLAPVPVAAMPRHPVKVRSSGRWQATLMPPARQRAAA